MSPHAASNVRRRVLAKAVAKAEKKLTAKGDGKFPKGLTPHSLRRTFPSILFALGESPPHLMAQMGHTTPTLTLAIYARQMDRRDGEPEQLKVLVEGANGQPLDSGNAHPTSNGTVVQAENGANSPVNSAISPE